MSTLSAFSLRLWLAKLFQRDGALSSQPALGSLRLASHNDVPRLGVVAEGGFYYSPVFEYERPKYKDFPQDTLQSYQDQFRRALFSDDQIVIVAEDSYDPEESSKTEAAIPTDNSWQPPANGQKVIVGLLSLKLAPSSKRRGQAVAAKGATPPPPPNEGRDLNREHYNGWGDCVAAARRKYCPDDSIIAMLVVHPAYWRRGHGTRLTQWAIALSQADSVNQCVSATGMGYVVFERLGFEVVSKIEAPGDEVSPEGLQTHLMRFDITAVCIVLRVSRRV